MQRNDLKNNLENFTSESFLDIGQLVLIPLMVFWKSLSKMIIHGNVYGKSIDT